MVIEFQLGADFLSWPTWFSHYEGPHRDRVGDFNPEELPISQNTWERLKKWKAVYDDLYQEDYSVRPMSEEEERIWSREKLRLWAQISKEISAAQENSSNTDIYRAYHPFMYQGIEHGFTLETLPDELREKYREDIDHSSESLL